MLESSHHSSVTFLASSVPVISVLVDNLAHAWVKVHLLHNKMTKAADLPRGSRYLLSYTISSL
jgi:hypothetical protein